MNYSINIPAQPFPISYNQIGPDSLGLMPLSAYSVRKTQDPFNILFKPNEIVQKSYMTMSHFFKPGKNVKNLVTLKKLSNKTLTLIVHYLI